MIKLNHCYKHVEVIDVVFSKLIMRACILIQIENISSLGMPSISSYPHVGIFTKSFITKGLVQ
jgi:hypothetical protein